MDKTHVTNLPDSTGPAIHRELQEALQAFARHLARLVADRSGDEALKQRAKTDTSATTVEKQTTNAD